MSLLNALTALSSGRGGASALLPVLLEQVKKYPGGLAGLVENFNKGGLGAIIASWIGTGANLPISTAQLQSVLGNQWVSEVAQQSGQDSGSVLDTLASLLPTVIDKATPEGRLPADGKLDASALLGAVSGLFGRG